REFAQAEKKSERFQDQYNELLSARQEVQVRLDALRLEADVPSEAELEQVRLRRDQGWRMVQQALSDADWRRNDEVAKFIGEFAPSGDLADAFSASMAKADEI